MGYHIRLEAKKSLHTQILFMTTGVLLRMLQISDNHLKDVSHIFVDEVHERDVNTDFLLIVLTKLLAVRKDLKIILMSATLRAEIFTEYFGKRELRDVIEGKYQLVNIPGRAFPVTTYYLEDAIEQIGT